MTEGQLSGSRLDVDGELTLGREQSGASSLGGDPELSRAHARFQPGSAGQLIVEDLGSVNGTIVNGQRIERPTVLRAGDSIEVGTTKLVVGGEQATRLAGGEQATRLSRSPVAQTRLSTAAVPEAPPVAPPPAAPPAAPPVGPPVPSVPPLGRPAGRPGGRRDPRLPVLGVLLVLALIGLVVALATRGSTASSDGPFDGTAYVLSNRAAPNGNSVLAYRYRDGSLAPLRLREYPTGGSGGGKAKLLANDADQQVLTNAAHTLLFAVNQGSDSIAVFHIASDGTLSPVKGSPFPSGGAAPVSVAISGNTLVVVNKAIDDVRNLATVRPTIVTFKVQDDGTLTRVGQPAFSTPMASPDQALLVPSGRLLVVPELFKGDLLTFTRGSDGAFRQLSTVTITKAQASFGSAPKGPAAAAAALALSRLPPGAAPPSPPPGAPPGFSVQGFVAHPTQNYLYGSLTIPGELLVYSYDAAGNVTFVKGLPIPNGVGTCWAAVTPDGRFLYLGVTFNGTVAALDLSNPASPRFIQSLKLMGNGNTFNVRVDPSGKELFALTARNIVSPFTSDQLHVLQIGSDGRLFEAVAPVGVPVDVNPGQLGLTAPDGLVFVPHS